LAKARRNERLLVRERGTTMRFAIFVLIAAVFSLTASASRGQMKSNMFDAVPATDRESMRDAVLKDVQYQINREWSEMHKLYDNPTNISLKQFTREMKTSIRLLKFNPTSVAYVPPAGHWLTTGCAAFARDTADKRTFDAVVTARNVSDGWRMSIVAISGRKDPPKCISKENNGGQGDSSWPCEICLESPPSHHGG
jgi:hypothetical protein